MGRTKPKTWPELGFESWALGIEASSVMWLRWNRLLSGGALADREMRRMISEKVEAGFALGPTLALSGARGSTETIGDATLKHYRKRVRANRRRLTR